MLEHTRRTWIDSVDVLIKLAEVTEIVEVMRLDNSKKYVKLNVTTVGTHKNPFLLMDFDGKVEQKGIKLGDVCTFRCWLNAKGLTLFVVIDDIFCHRNSRMSFKKWLNFTLDLDDLQETVGRVIQKSRKFNTENSFIAETDNGGDENG